MKRMIKVGFWLLGLALLVFLIQFPMNKSLDVTKFSLPLSGKTIVLDPGHGGPDGGAVGKDGTTEEAITLAVSKKLSTYLKEAGATVYLTREEDKDLASEESKGLSRRKAEDIRNRMNFIHNHKADFFLSIHLNALPSTRWRGAQTFYYPGKDENKHLAKMIQAEIIRNLENTNREALAKTEMYLLKHAEVPGALVEIGFLSNVDERELLKQEDYQDKMAASIYEGILRYTTEEIKAEDNE
ncbi:N-acetylmuramoyl-L-alanine amidase CwlD [Oceanobacillus caeni]|uniref:N-acetylmuramoyl-L-alanine amidase CwlD n=1 Tax=Oceanobacillus caeni TaxID=405946 RepID=UPI00195D3C38|nr:N-acetylmuramoyl-L-alanine amidase CwlD [Oceanobacillus caeni]MBU8791079.1 N-acetylmuramoyl-L-alanine amidase CwlD [Oceanobacillus caeni]MCR1835182.1 N-acetylmuramoyl-L-alanine amidase CwlD [Oceanobacillus caeni]